MDKSILIVGVGGQGTLLASKIIGNVAISNNFDVKVSEVHGMSQRGGSVVTYVKYSDKKVHSPIICKGEADIILAFEFLEAYRNIGFLKSGGQLLANVQKITPMPVILGVTKYPANIEDEIEQRGIRLTAIDALEAAKSAGNEKAVNTVLIGLMAKSLEKEDGELWSKSVWRKALETTVPSRLLDINLKAFELGYEI